MTDKEVLARTMWGEARSAGEAGMTAVGCVVRNRVNAPGWWGHDWQTVCLKPWQFSCWNHNDPNREKLLAVTEADSDYSLALQIAQKIILGEIADTTQGADSYYDISITAPYWADVATLTMQIGPFMLYRTIS